MERSQMKTESANVVGPGISPPEISTTGKGKTSIASEHLSILVGAASAYADSSAKSFGLFITVAFGSLAFATALAKTGGTTAGPSVLMTVALLAFYVIDFIAFQSANKKLSIVLGELSRQIECWDFKNSETLSVFQPEKPMLGNLGLPSIGYLIGSVLGLVTFVWILFA